MTAAQTAQPAADRPNFPAWRHILFQMFHRLPTETAQIAVGFVFHFRCFSRAFSTTEPSG
jgi:hypothetical protein